MFTCTLVNRPVNIMTGIVITQNNHKQVYTVYNTNLKNLISWLTNYMSILYTFTCTLPKPTCLTYIKQVCLCFTV